MADTETEEPKPKKSKAKVVVAIVAALVLLGGGGTGAAFFLGLFANDAPAAEQGGETSDEDEHINASSHGTSKGGKGDGKVAADETGPAFLDLPDVIVNLSSNEKRMRFLKLRVSLETKDEKMAMRVGKLMPRVLDSFQLYLRSLTPEDLSGARGFQQLKEELVARVNLALGPEEVDNVLIKEMLIQ